jgi:hypothetical protein
LVTGDESQSEDADDDEPTTTTHYSPFGQEVRRREAHVTALPGKVPAEWFDSLNRASTVFSGNSLELVRHLSRFVGTMMHVRELPDDFDVEANRLLHNYLASLATLRDVQRTIHHKLWPERHAPDDPNDKRTKWEVEIWTPQVTKHFGDDSIRFLVDLRNFSLHYAIPPVTLTTRWHGSGGEPMQWTNEVALDRNELLKYSGWSGAARRYIATDDRDIEFLPIVATYSLRVREFFAWFWERVMDAKVDEPNGITVRIQIAEYYGKKGEYEHWRKVEGTWGRFGPDGRRVQRPRLAAARQERSEFGTSGWRTIALNETGEWVVGESDWPPLPPGPR